MSTFEKLARNPSADAGRFLDADERDGLAGRALRILGIVRDAQNRFGPRWIVSVLDIGTGEKLAIGLADNPARNAVFPVIAAEIEDSGAEAIEPVVLVRVKPDKGGNPFWSFVTADSSALAAADAEHETPDDDSDDVDDDAASEPAPVRSHRSRA